MQKQKITSDAAKSSAKPKSAGLQVKSVSTVGNINVGLKAVPQKPANVQDAEDTKAAKPKQKKAAKAEKPVKSPKVASEKKMPFSALISKSGIASSSRLPLIGGIVGVCVVFLLVLLVAGGSDTKEADVAAPVAAPKPSAVAPVVTAKPAAPEVEPTAPVTVAKSEEAPVAPATEASGQSTQLLMGNIISALRQHDDAAETAAAESNTAAETELTSVSNLAKMVVTAMEQGQSEAYIQQLLNEAQANGEIRVPAPLLRSDGSVDTSTILSLFAKN